MKQECWLNLDVQGGSIWKSMDSGVQNIMYSASATVAVTSSETLAVCDFIALQAT
jgi:hypothetical protein